MIIKYEYIQAHHLLLVRWNGVWDSKEYDVSLRRFSEMLQNMDVHSVIHDISSLDFNIKNLNINKLIKIRKERITKNFKTVYLTKFPKDVVFSHLYSMGFVNSNDFMYCHTTEKAISLLSLSISNSELKEALTSLKNTVKLL